MSHRRIRPGNTRNGHLAPDLDFGFSKAVVAGDQVFLVGCTGLSLDGSGFVGKGDPAVQAEAAMANVRTLVEETGARMEDICLINNFTTRHRDRAQVYPVIARHLHGVNPVSTGLVVEALAAPYIDFEIDAWVVIPHDRERSHDRFRVTNARGGFLMPNIDYGNARVIVANDHLFLQGQTGMSLDGRSFDGTGDPARQAEVAMQNVLILLADAGASMDDVCKITTYLTDPTDGAQIDAVLAHHFGGIGPVVTSTVVKELARPELDFEIDVHALRHGDDGHERRPVSANSPVASWPQSRSVRAGDFLFLQGQGGMPLDGGDIVGRGRPAAQAEQAMRNVKVLLAEAGGGMMDICKITTYVTDLAARRDIYPVLGRHLRDAQPVSTGVVMKALSRPEMDFVVDVFAVIT
jgi:enamine deaminase RidA (YjgF/YER057c/UK114 family)